MADSLELAEGARALAATPAGAAEPVASVLADVASFSDQHAEQLGGTYVSGLPTPTASASPASSPPVAPDAATFLAELATATTTALSDADAVEDGDLARLVASIATSRAELTTRLAQAAALPAPAVDPSADGATAPPATDAATPAATPDPSAGPVPVADLDALALAHDQAGFAFEVIAPSFSGDQRTAARAAASANRSDGERWARASGSDGTPQDPGRASYALPVGMDDPAVAVTLGRTVESAVADAYATAVAAAPAGDRLPFVLTACARRRQQPRRRVPPGPVPRVARAGPEAAGSPTVGVRR